MSRIHHLVKARVEEWNTVCGVFGVVSGLGLMDRDSKMFEYVSDHLRHRGPDSSAIVRSENYLLGMHRLSIMDMEHGDQPFSSEDGRFTVLGNGEIYNSKNLRDQLIALGHTIKSTSDIEVIPHLFEMYGVKAVDHLRGMFALVVVDKSKGVIHLIRDRLGEKPLIYHQDRHTFWFSSELTPLVKAGVVGKEIDALGLRDYLLYGFVPEPRTIIRNVKKIPPGAILTIDLKTLDLRVDQYWSAIDHVGDQVADTEMTLSSLREAVHLSTQSDAPVAVALSGGLDSSLVSALALEFRSDLQAFTVGYEEDTSTDERSAAQQFAERIGLPLIQIELRTAEVAEQFSIVCAARDEPIADVAGSAYSALAQRVRESGYPVLLNGQGGDELFWGYPWIRDLAQRGYLSSGGTLPIGINHPRYGIPNSPASFARQLETRAGTTINSVFSNQESIPDNSTESFQVFDFQPGFRSYRNQTSHLTSGESQMKLKRFTFNSPEDSISAVMLNLLSTYLLSNGLTQMDRLTMRHSVEARTPLVDYKIVELALSSQTNSHSLFSSPKGTLRAVAREVLPNFVLERPKNGFTPPIRRWNQRIWQINRSVIQEPLIAEIPFLNEKYVKSIMRKPKKMNCQVNQMAMRLLTLELWYRSL